MPSLKCNHCNWQGSVHDVDGFTLSEMKDLESAYKTANKKPLTQHNGLCPNCMSIKIIKI